MPGKIPLEDFFRNVEKSNVKLSPDGRYLAWMEPWKTRLNVFVKELSTGEVTRVTSEEEQDLWNFVWGSSDRIVFHNDTGGDENTRLFGVKPDGSDLVSYTPFEGVRCWVIDLLQDDPEHVLFTMNRRDPREMDAFRLNLNTGDIELAAQNPGEVSEWIVDHSGRLRLAEVTDGLKTRIIYRDTENDPWREVASYDFRESAIPLRFAADGRSFYVASNLGRNTRAICSFSVDSDAPGEVLFSHPDVDVSEMLYSRKLGKPVGVCYTEDKIRYTWFDESREALQTFIDGELPSFSNLLLSHTDDEDLFVVYSGDDRTRGTYYLLDAVSMKLDKLFEVSPWLDRDSLCPMQTISYTARDGLQIGGYLTLPLDVPPENLPVVVYPHGGPWIRDNWGFKPVVQFLANRGYAVFRMNFRGSTGFGRKFLEAGYGQWGLSMQDDITDGVQWLIDKGIADPARIAIFGVSYGGYAVLMGIVKDPDLYAAAVDLVGVSNLFTILENMPPYWEEIREMMYLRIGHPERDRERLVATSPALNTDGMKTPLLIGQGANDPRVNQVESDQVVNGLRAKGIPVMYILKQDEGHGFFKEENKFEFYRATEEFLAEHLGNR